MKSKDLKKLLSLIMIVGATLLVSCEGEEKKEDKDKKSSSLVTTALELFIKV